MYPKCVSCFAIRHRLSLEDGLEALGQILRPMTPLGVLWHRPERENCPVACGNHKHIESRSPSLD